MGVRWFSTPCAYLKSIAFYLARTGVEEVAEVVAFALSAFCFSSNFFFPLRCLCHATRFVLFISVTFPMLGIQCVALTLLSHIILRVRLYSQDRLRSGHHPRLRRQSTRRRCPARRHLRYGHSEVCCP